VAYRTIEVPRRAKLLTGRVYWENTAERWVDAGNFKVTGPDNQWVSLDLIKPDAKPFTTSRRKVLKPIFEPVEAGGGDPPVPYSSGGWKRFSTNLKPYRGEKVRLRWAEADNQFFMSIGIDDLRVRSESR
jgi:hypothetical protein